MQVQISWPLQKPTDLDVQCLLQQAISMFSMTRVNAMSILVGDFVSSTSERGKASAEAEREEEIRTIE